MTTTTPFTNQNVQCVLPKELAHGFINNSIQRLEFFIFLYRKLYTARSAVLPKAHDSFNRSAFLQPDGARSKMFNNNSEGKDVRAKQEGSSNEHIIPNHTSTSRQWAGFKNPRIVRVSKDFGGKDRHSKVCTVKGLRDRRIRLSVPTAIQLYDLQDRLGLNQPSKVIDWLLDSTKDDIDKLPPLQMIPGDVNQFHQAPTTSFIPQDLNSPQISFSQFLTNPNATFVKDVGNRTLLYTKQGMKLDNYHDINGDHQRMKGKEALVEKKWNEQENGDGNGGLNFFPIPQYSYPGLFPYNPSYNWEPNSNVAISQFGNQGLISSHTDPSMVLPSASQFFLCPPAAITPPPFPPYLMSTLAENYDLARENNNFHLVSSSSPNVPPNFLLPLLNANDSQERVPFSLDAHPKVRSQKNVDS
ncbi:unnamed protein product [Lactuca virosa]|uniref:TCP domain-containing protein n=1 Tax=Lactuca virosa TaxID=75947 RepID=A0AAU9M755_9ASTR|nr:unnamed protein product [Lactuca virosa]